MLALAGRLPKNFRCVVRGGLFRILLSRRLLARVREMCGGTGSTRIGHTGAVLRQRITARAGKWVGERFDDGRLSLGVSGVAVAQEASFKEFCERPENKPMLIKHQQSEVRKAMRLNRKMKAMVRNASAVGYAWTPRGHAVSSGSEHAARRGLSGGHERQTQRRLAVRREVTPMACTSQEFKEKVMESDYDAQKNMAPFLENKVLRKIVQTFTNDPRNDFSKWANNPLVIRMLTKAKELMDEGRMTEDEAEHLILQQLNVRRPRNDCARSHVRTAHRSRRPRRRRRGSTRA
jgi:hypothetical protein